MSVSCAATYQVCCVLNEDTVPKPDLLYDFRWHICTQLMLLSYQLLQTLTWECIFCTNVDSSCNRESTPCYCSMTFPQTAFLTVQKQNKESCTHKPGTPNWKFILLFWHPYWIDDEHLHHHCDFLVAARPFLSPAESFMLFYTQQSTRCHSSCMAAEHLPAWLGRWQALQRNPRRAITLL